MCGPLSRVCGRRKAMEPTSRRIAAEPLDERVPRSDWDPGRAADLYGLKLVRPKQFVDCRATHLQRACRPFDRIKKDLGVGSEPRAAAVSRFESSFCIAVPCVV